MDKVKNLKNDIIDLCNHSIEFFSNLKEHTIHNEYDTELDVYCDFQKFFRDNIDFPQHFSEVKAKLDYVLWSIKEGGAEE